MKVNIALALIVTMLLAGASNAQEKDFRSFLGKTPPELVNKDATWLGRNVGRRTLESLKGGAVVWLEFGFMH